MLSPKASTTSSAPSLGSGGGELLQAASAKASASSNAPKYCVLRTACCEETLMLGIQRLWLFSQHSAHSTQHKFSLSTQPRFPGFRGFRPITQQHPARVSFPRNGHPLDQHRAGLPGAAYHHVGSDCDDAAEHVLEIAGNRDFLHRKGDLAVLHPET